MMLNKKRILLIVIAILLVAAVATGTVLLISALNKNSNNTAVKSTKAGADKIKAQAIEAKQQKDTAKAKTLLEEANKQYKEQGDTTNVVDTDTQLKIIEYEATQKKNTSPTP